VVSSVVGGSVWGYRRVVDPSVVTVVPALVNCVTVVLSYPMVEPLGVVVWLSVVVGCSVWGYSTVIDPPAVKVEPLVVNWEVVVSFSPSVDPLVVVWLPVVVSIVMGNSVR